MGAPFTVGSEKIERIYPDPVLFRQDNPSIAWDARQFSSAQIEPQRSLPGLFKTKIDRRSIRGDRECCLLIAKVSDRRVNSPNDFPTAA